MDSAIVVDAHVNLVGQVTNVTNFRVILDVVNMDNAKMELAFAQEAGMDDIAL